MVGIRSVICGAAVLVALSGAGCGGESSEEGLARFAPPGSLVYAEVELKPEAKLKVNVDAAAKRIAGIDDLGDFVVSELESSAGGDGDSLDFETEVEPWLGEEGSVAFERLVDGDLSEPLIAVATTDPEAAQAFVERHGKGGDAVGVIDDALVIAASEKEFEAAVDASAGDSLGDEERFQKAIEVASNASFADVYVDVGGILEQSRDKIDPGAREVLQSAGIDPSEATAVASVIPHSEQIEVDLSSDLGGEKAPSGDVSELLGSLPARSLAAFAFAEFGEQLEEAVDSLDEAGIPPTLKPGELKGTLGQAGINLDRIAGSLEDGAVFVEGTSRDALGGALVLTGKSSEAADAVVSLGRLLRAARIPGITAVTGKASGFSIRSEDLGDKPVVILGKGNRVSIGYGPRPAFTGLAGNSGATLGETAGFKAASKALGKTPISAYVDGPAALRLAEALVPRSSSDFWDARRYLRKLTYIGIGTGIDGELATAKLIAGIGK